MIKKYISAVSNTAAVRCACMPMLAGALGLGMLAQARAETAAPAAPACRYSEVGAMDVHYPYPGSMPAIQGEINGGAVHIGIDTGATRTMLLRAEADRHNLALAATDRRFVGIGGASIMYAAKVRDLSVGGTHVRNSLFPVVDHQGENSIGMIFGTDFLFKNDVEIALGANQIKMFHAEGCSERALAYWDADALHVELLNFDEAGNRWALVEVTLNGKPFRAMLDTGAARSLVSTRTVAQLGVKRDAPGALAEGQVRGFGNDQVDAWSVEFDSFAIGREAVTRPRITVTSFDKMRVAGLNIDMILGRDFFRTHHVLIAASQKQFYYTYLGGDVFMTRSGAAKPAPAPAGMD